MVIFKYDTEAESQAIISEQTAKGMVLVAISNITEGNFLGFDDSKVQLDPSVIGSVTPPPTVPPDIQTQLQDLNNTVNMILLKQEGII